VSPMARTAAVQVLIGNVIMLHPGSSSSNRI
jgi:hypothetical protein